MEAQETHDREYSNETQHRYHQAGNVRPEGPAYDDPIYRESESEQDVQGQPHEE